MTTRIYTMLVSTNNKIVSCKEQNICSKLAKARPLTRESYTETIESYWWQQKDICPLYLALVL